MDLRYYLRVLSRRKWLILAVVLTAAAATFIVSLLLPATYEAEARFFTGIANTYTVPSFEEENDPTDIQYEIETQLLSLEQQILSQQVLSLVACELILHDLDPQNDPFRNLEGLNTTYSLTDLKNAQKYYQTRLDSLQPLITTGGNRKVYGDILKFMGYDINSLLKNLITERTPGTDIIRIKYSSSDPELSAFTVNALGNQFGRYYETQLVERNRNSISYFSGLARQNQEELSDVIASQEDFVDIMKNYSSRDARRILSRIRHLERLRLEEESQIRSLVKSLDIINEQLGPTSNSILAPSAYADAIAKQRNLVNRFRKRLIRKVTFDEPFTVVEDSLLQQTTLLDRQLYQFTKNSISNLLPLEERLKLLRNDRKTALQFARENLQQIDGSLSLTRNQTFARVDQQMGISSQNDEVTGSMVNYGKVIDRLFAARSFTLGDETQTGRFENAQTPDQPVPSKRWGHIGIATLLSLSLCVFTLLLLEVMDTSVKTATHFERVANLPLLSSLNFLPAENLDLVGLFNDTSSDPNQEAYKHLMRKIRFEVISSGGKVFLLTSTRPGAGKTSLLLSLGYSLSLNKKKILLIDTHFNNNQITRMTSATPALERYMADEIPFSRLISPSGLEGVDILGSEGGNYTPLEVFVPQEKFQELLEQLSESYEYIFMEGPALNQYSGSKELIQFADKVIPVFSAKATIKQPDKQSIKFLKSIRDKLLGSVLNKVSLEDIEE